MRFNNENNTRILKDLIVDYLKLFKERFSNNIEKINSLNTTNNSKKNSEIEKKKSNQFGKLINNIN